VLIAAVVVIVVAALVARQRRRRSSQRTWTDAAGRAVREGKLIVDQLGGGRAPLRQEAEPTAQRQLRGLDATLAALEAAAPSPERQQAARDARAVAVDLVAAIETDLSVRIGPPAPTDEQIAASNVLVMDRARRLDGALDQLALTTSQFP
jgi:hypothetical protein